MMKNVGVTLDNLYPYPLCFVYECDNCGFREKSSVEIDDCKVCRERIRAHHREEAEAGIL